MYVNARSFIDGVNAVKNGNEKIGWAMIGLSLVGGGASAVVLKQEIATVQNAAAKAIMTAQLRAQGVKFTDENIVAMTRMPDGKIVFLEKGQVDVPNMKDAGMAHIIKEHGAEFEMAGVGADKIPKFLIDTLESGKLLGHQGKGQGRPIFETVVNGVPVKVAITVSSNGYIVGANYLGKIK